MRPQPFKSIFQLAALLIIGSNLYGQNRPAEQRSNKDIAASYFTEVVNKQNLRLLDSIFSPSYLSHEMDGSEKHIISDGSLTAHLNYLFHAFPDLRYDIDQLIAENDLVALTLTASGTQKGEFLGYPASNRKIIFRQMFFFRLSSGKITEGWNVVDKDGVIQQLSRK